LWLRASPGKQFSRPYLEKPFTKMGLVEWLKGKALSSNASTTKQQQQQQQQQNPQKTQIKAAVVVLSCCLHS
jgi:hypothetical protein